MKFDLNLFALDDQFPLGLYATSAPKRTARGREEDQVILFFTQQGDKPLVGAALKDWQAKAAEVFYQTPGSVTSGMKATIEWLNRNLYQENLNLSPDQLKRTLEVSLCVVHRDILLVAQSGRSRVVVVSADGQSDFIDRDANQLGLGVHETPRISLYQRATQSNDVIVLGNEIPEELIPLLDSPTISSLRASLKDRIAIETPVFFVQIVSGDGQILKGTLPDREAEIIPPPLVHPEVESFDEPSFGASPETFTENKEDVEPFQETYSLAQNLFNLPVAPETPLATASETEKLVEPAREPDSSDSELGAQPTQSVFLHKNGKREPDSAPSYEGDELPVRQSEQTIKKAKLHFSENPEFKKMKKDTLSGVAKSAGWLKRAEASAGKAISRKVGQVNPQSGDDGGLPAAGKLIVAILVPLFMVAFAALVFFTQSHADDVAYLTRQAKVYYHNAEQVTDPSQQRAAWQEALLWIRQAAAVSNDPELETMRIQGETALDAMDGAVRLNFARSFDPTLFPDLRIKKIIVLNYDLYVLDSSSGSVLHFSKKGNSFEYDTTFVCGPGTYANIEIGKLVSMSEIQINNPARAPIVAIDNDGVTLYCSVGNTPAAARLSPPDNGFGEIRMMTVDSGRLMILDPVQNAIWIYRGISTQFDRAVDSYFEDMPVNLSQALEIAVNRDELFILHEDGHSSHYVASNITGLVTGQDSLAYSDIRASTPPIDFSEINLGRLTYSPPPDPSIYYLAPATAELYQFSLKLNLNRVLRSGSVQGALPIGEVDAFAVTSNQLVFLAFDNRLYHATLP